MKVVAPPHGAALHIGTAVAAGTTKDLGRLLLPLDVITATIGIVAQKGAGKTYTSKVFVEELAKAALPFVVLDPLGVWWGLRSSPDGKDPGLPVIILGGEHGDIPLEPTAGAVVADFIIDNPGRYVLDLSGFPSKAAMRRFVTAFLVRLYHRNRDPLHVVLDEADLWAPQRPGKEGMDLLGACEDLVRRGRAKGIGVTLISQRPAVIHKDVLTQIDVLVCGRLVGPQDRNAVDEWAKGHGSDEERKVFLGSLASLPTGQNYWWSPAMLGIFALVQVRLAETFDSSKTPALGVRRVTTTFAQVDLGGLVDAMADTIERAKADDPRLLRQTIADLERRLQRAEARADAAEARPPVTETRVEIEERTPLDVIEAVARMKGLAESIGAAAVAVLDLPVSQPIVVDDATGNGRNAVTVLPPASPPPRRPAAPSGRVATAADIERLGKEVQAASLNKAERAILSVLAQHPAGRSRVQLALLSGYSVKSSSLSNALGSLRSAGLISKSGEPITITDDGVVALGVVDPLPSGPALYDWWCARLNKAERAILDVFVDAAGATVDRDEVAERSGYSAASSSLSNALGRLRSLEMLDGWRVHPDFLAAIS